MTQQLAKLVGGVVVSASTSQPAPASTITYSINVLYDDGNVSLVDGQKPSIERYPDYNASNGTGCLVVPLIPGTPVMGMQIDRAFFWMFRELPFIGACDTTPAPGPALLKEKLKLPDAIPTFSVGGAGTPSTPSGGGDQ